MSWETFFLHEARKRTHLKRKTNSTWAGPPPSSNRATPAQKNSTERAAPVGLPHWEGMPIAPEHQSARSKQTKLKAKKTEPYNLPFPFCERHSSREWAWNRRGGYSSWDSRCWADALIHATCPTVSQTNEIESPQTRTIKICGMWGEAQGK